MLVTGASGFIGSNLIDALDKAKLPVVPVGRATGGFDFCCDFSKEFDLSSILSEVDSVIHLAAVAHVKATDIEEQLIYKVNVESTVELARQAAASGVRRFIFLSSIGVCGSSSLTPFKIGMKDSPHDLYSESKKDAEHRLKEVAAETGLELVIVRPTLVYGDGAPGNFSKLIKMVASGIPLPFSGIHNSRSFISVFNLVDFLVLCVQHSAAAGETFFVADAENISTAEFMEEICKALGCPCRLFYLPSSIVLFLFSFIGKKGLYNKMFGDLEGDISHAIKMLDWVPPVSLSLGLKRSIGKSTK